MLHNSTANRSLTTDEDNKPYYVDLVKPKDLARERPDLFSDAKMIWLIRQRRLNGLSDAGAVIKCGRTILIVRSKFYEWLLANKA